MSMYDSKNNRIKEIEVQDLDSAVITINTQQNHQETQEKPKSTDFELYKDYKLNLEKLLNQNEVE